MLDPRDFHDGEDSENLPRNFEGFVPGCVTQSINASCQQKNEVFSIVQFIVHSSTRSVCSCFSFSQADSHFEMKITLQE